jgi:monoamine oxidase
MRAQLAAPVEDRIFFAGEACSAHAFSTAHGAYETGVAAAEAVLAQFRPAVET